MGAAPSWTDLAAGPVQPAARALVGECGRSAIVHHDGVAVLLTEVEGYGGEDDPGSHAFRGRTRRNAAMFGPPGTVYCYRIYGMHVCLNLVCGPVGEARAVLVRAGVVVEGLDLARLRRARPDGTAPADAALARGPANLVRALGIRLDHDGSSLTGSPGTGIALTWTPTAGRRLASGPRVGVSGEGGDPRLHPWRHHVTGEPSVSRYRAAPRPGRSSRA